MSAECWTKSLPCCIVINRNSMNGCLLMAVIWIKCRRTKSAGANGWPHKSKPACGRERTNTVTWYFTLTARRGERESSILRPLRRVNMERDWTLWLGKSYLPGCDLHAQQTGKSSCE